MDLTNITCRQSARTLLTEEKFKFFILLSVFQDTQCTVSKLHGGRGEVEIDFYKILSFFLKPPKEALIQEMFWCLWKWTNGPEKEWQKQPTTCAERFGTILSVFLNRSAHPGFFPNGILITCSQIVVFFQTACSFIIKEPAISDSIIESYIVYKNWYSE